MRGDHAARQIFPSNGQQRHADPLDRLDTYRLADTYRLSERGREALRVNRRLRLRRWNPATG